MDEFLTVNPGLAGRFNRKLRFESYSPVEIVEIGHRYATPRASQLDDAAREVFLDAVTTIRNYTTPSGQHGIDAMQNGRFARNVIERAEGFRDTRVVAQNVRANRYRFRICRSSPPPTSMPRYAACAQTTETWPRSFGSSRISASAVAKPLSPGVVRYSAYAPWSARRTSPGVTALFAQPLRLKCTQVRQVAQGSNAAQ